MPQTKIYFAAVELVECQPGLKGGNLFSQVTQGCDVSLTRALGYFI
jgi:hypothetical protein